MSAESGPRPQGLYVAATLSGNTVRTAGMTPRRDGVLLITGRVGAEVGLTAAREAAAVAVGNALAAVSSVIGATTAFRCVEMVVYIACTPDFVDLSRVADGATEVLLRRFGPTGLPSRSAIGVYALPGGAPVEISLTVDTIPASP